MLRNGQNFGYLGQILSKNLFFGFSGQEIVKSLVFKIKFCPNFGFFWNFSSKFQVFVKKSSKISFLRLNFVKKSSFF